MTPSENLRPLSTRQRFLLLVDALVTLAPQWGYGGSVPTFAICQSALETQLFTSDLLLRADNAFGMRIASQRPQPWVIGVSNNYAVYDDIKGSVSDYYDRQRAKGIPSTDNPHVYMDATVASGYATASNYKGAWMELFERVTETDFETAFRLSDTPSDPGGPVQAGSGGNAVVLLLALWAGYEMTKR